MGTFWQDIKYGFRMLLKNPGFTAIAVLTLALGIGANTALFSVVNGVLLNPLPYTQPNQLVKIYSKTTQWDEASISYPNFLDWLHDNRSFTSMAAFRGDDFNLTGSGEPERLRGFMISASLFDILGVHPVLGRTFRPEEDQVGAGPVVMISGGLWKRKFGSARDVIGKTMTLNGADYTIVGVLPASFRIAGREARDVYVPIGQWNDPTFRDRRIGMGSQAIGRLKPGITLGQARADMAGITKNLAAAFPEADANSGVTIVPFKKDVVGDVEPYLFVLLGAVAFVLLIACANVANLLLARATGRAREFAVRTALGASQMRVIRQLLTESILLSVGGGALGLLLAWRGTRAIIAILPDALPRSDEIGIDGRVLFFTLGVSLLAGVIFGLAPAFKTWRTNLQETLKEGGRGSSGSRHRTQNIFVVVEMAMALILLVGAGLMIRSLAALWSVNPGFDPRNVLTLSVSLPPSLGANPATIRAALRELDDRIKAIPGIEASTITAGSLPMTDDSELPFWHEGQPKPATDTDMDWSLFYLVEPGQLNVMRTPLQRGRFLTAQDDEHSPPVIVIDETFARKFFPNEDPIGKRVNLGLLGLEPEIVGIVGHIKQWGLGTDGPKAIEAQFYLPIMQVPDQFLPLFAHGVGVLLRSKGSPLSVVGSVRLAIEKMNSQQVVYDVQTMDSIIADSIAARKFSMILLAVFAALALVLASIGIYGVISYLVGQRVHEIGLRMALGAQPGDVLRLIVGEGAKLALIGVGIGLATALALTRLMTKMLFGVSAYDPLTFAGVAILLVLVALVACYIPARRAMRVDPMVALRYE
ncbi:MAG: ABC transporter permease [Candidatus Acidiferrales bacterium]